MKEPPHDETREQLLESISTLMDLSNRILSRVEEVEMSQISSPTSVLGNSGFTEAQEQFIYGVMAETVAMGQSDLDSPDSLDQLHQHGGRADCEGCHAVAVSAMQTARNAGQADAVTYYNSIPGITELRTAYESAQAEALAGQETLQFVG